jgi:hypothetical protein
LADPAPRENDTEPPSKGRLRRRLLGVQ